MILTTYSHTQKNTELHIETAKLNSGGNLCFSTSLVPTKFFSYKFSHYDQLSIATVANRNQSIFLTQLSHDSMTVFFWAMSACHCLSLDRIHMTVEMKTTKHIWITTGHTHFFQKQILTETQRKAFGVLNDIVQQQCRELHVSRGTMFLKCRTMLMWHAETNFWDYMKKFFFWILWSLSLWQHFW